MRIAGAVVTGALWWAAEGRAEDAESTFRNHCASCHVAPDLKFPADRAWLEQVQSTA